MKISFMLASSIIMIATSSLAIATQSPSYKYEKYQVPDNFIPLSETELDETTGKMGPLVAGILGGVNGGVSSITTDVLADKPISWSDAGLSAGAGFVGGMTGNVFFGNTVKGAIASTVLSSSASGAIKSIGKNCQSSCH
ncbi:TPA: hypothetical protein M2Q89_004894 [Escherichia coli]|jgi:hypothetical protein|nr:hypothetical protein [Escherichia coli]